MKKTFKLLIMTAVLLLVLLPAVYASDFAYTIDSVTLADEYGDSFSDDEGICVVTAEVTKHKDITGEARVWFAGYDACGKLLNAEFSDISIDVGETGYEVVELISSPNKIDKICVFVWNKDDGTTPLAEGVAKEPEKDYAYYSPELFYNINEMEISFRRNPNTSSIVRHKFSPTFAELYVNGVEYMEISPYTTEELRDILHSAYGDIKLVFDESKRVERIEVEYRIYARITQKTQKDSIHTLWLGGISCPGNVIYAGQAGSSIKIDEYDIADGYIKMSTERNGKKCNISDLCVGDVISVGYDIYGKVSDSEFIDISATDRTVTAKYISFDAEKESYTLMDQAFGIESQYKALQDISYVLENGSEYKFSLTPEGMLYDYEIVSANHNFAIVERYVDINTNTSTSSEYSYIQVMTLGGEEKTLFIDDRYEMEAHYVLSDMGITATIGATAQSVPIEDRIIEYTLSSNGRIKEIKASYDVQVYSGAVYSEVTGRLGKMLSSDCNILDATQYTEALADSGKPSISDYKRMSVSRLIDEEEYDVILIYRNSSAEYENVIITRASAMAPEYTCELERDKIVNISENEVLYKTAYTEYGIVESFIDINTSMTASEYSYVQVMTFDGQAKTLHIESNYDSKAAKIMNEIGIRSTIGATAGSVDICDRVIKYTVNTSTGRIVGIEQVDCEQGVNVNYEGITGKLGKPLSNNAVILDATDYMDSLADSGKPLLTDYKSSSLSALIDGSEYNAVLVKPNDNVYDYVIITSGTLDEIQTSPEEQEKEYRTESIALDNAKLYINNAFYCDVNSANLNKINEIIKYSNDKILFKGKAEGVYTSIYADVNVSAEVSDIYYSGDEFTIEVDTLSNIPAEINTINLNAEVIRAGEKKLTIKKNGQKATFLDIKKGDILTIIYDMSGDIDSSSFISLEASDVKVKAYFEKYSDGVCSVREINKATTDEYKTIISDVSIMQTGNVYEFYLDSMQRICKVKGGESVNFSEYAIVERFIDINEMASTSAEYSYVQMLTLDGTAVVGLIESDYERKAADIFDSMGIRSTVAATAQNVSIQDRIIHYSLNSKGRIQQIEKVNAAVILAMEYDSADNTLWQPLSDECIVIDATGYVENCMDYATKPSINDYKKASLSALKNGTEYDAVLVSQNDNGEYEYAIILAKGSILNGESDFAVAAADFKRSSKASVNGEDVYTLDVMENGASASRKINISTNARAYFDGMETDLTDIKAGSVFFYTTDENNFVDKISIVYVPNWFDALIWTNTDDMLRNISLPDFGNGATIRPDDWMISLDDRMFAVAKEEIQLLLAPVVMDGAKYVSVSPIKYDTAERIYYIDTNETYDYAINDNTKIYSFDMSGDTTGINRFSNGYFSGISLKDCEPDGKAWLGTVRYLDNFDFSYSVQPAFLMVVDGVVTNALVFTN